MSIKDLATSQHFSTPKTLPFFAVSGAILLPNTRQPLNIFQETYTQLIDDALGQERLVGIIQPSEESTELLPHPPLYKVGTVGKIVSFSETDDGRYLVTLEGICRFSLIKEVTHDRAYRRAEIDITPYLTDLQPNDNKTYDRTRLINVLRSYFRAQGVSADWSIVQNTSNEELVSSLAMICPLEPNEKQALLEAASFAARVELLITLLEMASMTQESGETARH